MKLSVILSTLLGAGAIAASHNIAHGHVHKARDVKPAAAPDSAFLNDRAVTAADCDKGALINKLLATVPTSLVSAMLAEPIPFHNDSPPEFWTKLDDHEKECMVALWPVNAEQVQAQATEVGSAQSSTTEPCTDTTITSTITQTLTVTLPPTAPVTPLPTITPSQTLDATNDTGIYLPVIESTAAVTAPYGNGTATQTLAPSGTGISNATNATNPSLPEFTSGQGMLRTGFVSTTMAALAAVAICFFA